MFIIRTSEDNGFIICTSEDNVGVSVNKKVMFWREGVSVFFEPARASVFFLARNFVQNETS